MARHRVRETVEDKANMPVFDILTILAVASIMAMGVMMIVCGVKLY